MVRLHIFLTHFTFSDFHARSGHRVIVDDKYMYCWGGYNPEFWEVENTEDTAYPLFKEVSNLQYFDTKNRHCITYWSI